MKQRLLLLFITFGVALGLHASKGWIDITSAYLTNAGFDSGDAGWTYTYDRGTHNNRVGASEFWNATFDIHQTISGLPAGHYRVSCKAFARSTSNDWGFYQYQMGQSTINSKLYAGSNTQTVVSVYTWSSTTNLANGCWQGRDGNYYPNTMESGVAAFSEGAYSNTLEFDHTGGDINVGLKNETWTDNNWCLFDDFKLEYYGDIVAVSSISLSATALQLVVGETSTLTATVLPTDATLKTLQWSSSNSSVARVDSKGHITALSAGTAVITAAATDGSGQKAQCTVTVVRHPATAGSIVINEIMAANVDQFVSPAFNFDGWMELYNPTDQAVELGGIYMSNDPANPKLWLTPDTLGAVPAKGYKVVWFDSNVIRTDHATFKLDVDGGTIALYTHDGELIAQADYPEALERVSYARTTDGGDQWGLTANATPGATNSTSTFATEQLDAPVVDQPSQLFTSSLSVQVTIPAGTTLRYTTDGTLPTMAHGATSTTGSFSVSQTSMYRFRLFEDGYLPSRVTTRSYILRDKDYNLPVVSVVSDPDFLYSDSLGVYVRGVNGRRGNGQSSPCNWNMDWDRPVNFSYITTDNQMAINQDVDLEMCGGWSRAYTPHSFKLKGSKEYGGNKNLDYPFFSAKPYIRNRTLQIRNGGNDNTCRIKDPALATIIQTSGVDIDLQSYQPVHEFVNGNYIGVLNMREPNNKHFVYANYGWGNDEIDQFEMSPDSGYCQKEGTAEAFDLLYSLSSSAADEASYEQIKQLLDIDEYIKYMAMEFYLGSSDWPQNNIKGFRKTDGGRFRFVSFDLDFAGNNSNAFTAFAGKQTYTFDNLYDSPVSNITQEIKMVTIFLNLLNNAEFRKQFIDTYCLMGGSVFEPSRCTAIIDSLTTIVGPEMALNNESPYNTANSLKSMLNSRLSTAISALKGYSPMQLSSVTARTAQLSSDTEGATLFVDGIEVPTGKFSGQLFAPVTLRAEAPAGYTFAGWRTATDNLTTLFDKGTTWSYYDQGSLDGQQWYQSTYSITGWSSSKAPLGYGKTGLSTTLSYGGNSSSKYPTYYFSRQVSLNSAPSASDQFVLSYTVDDGFIVYVNGQEAGRYNMPTGSVTFNTYSSTYASGNPDSGTMSLSASLFKKGENTIAVEVHNNAASSSDIYWDAALQTSMGASGSANYYSTDAEISMPTADFNLVASFQPLENAVDSGFTPVRINEVSAANEVFISDYAKKSDWVELYNTTSEPQDVEGMYLTDNLSKLQKCQLSKGSTTAQTVIPAHGYLVVWCDKRDTQRDLHASFKLSDDGGTVALSAADMSWTDSLTYPAHDGWHTVGRYNDGANSIYLMAIPTIGKKNQLDSYSQFVAEQTPTGIARVTTTAANGKLQLAYASGRLIVRGEGNYAEVNIYTLAGQLTATVGVNLYDGLGYVEAAQLPSGCYVARATDKSGHQAACKFVK
jgi:uncharacterized protein YjdB